MVDKSAVGTAFPPAHATVEAGRLRYFFETLRERNPVFRDPAAAREASYTNVPIPPTYLFCLESMDGNPSELLEILKIDLARVLHGEQRFEYYAPVMVGDTLTFASRVSDIAEKKGGILTIISVETRVTNQNNQHVADTVRSIVVRN
jgi:acyl dehydratase